MPIIDHLSFLQSPRPYPPDAIVSREPPCFWSRAFSSLNSGINVELQGLRWRLQFLEELKKYRNSITAANCISSWSSHITICLNYMLQYKCGTEVYCI